MSRNSHQSGEQYQRNVTEQYVDDAITTMKASLLDILAIEIKKSIEELKFSTINDLKKENMRLSTIIHGLEDNLDDLDDIIFKFEVAMNEQQQRSQRKCYMIYQMTS